MLLLGKTAICSVLLLLTCRKCSGISLEGKIQIAVTLRLNVGLAKKTGEEDSWSFQNQALLS